MAMELVKEEASRLPDYTTSKSLCQQDQSNLSPRKDCRNSIKCRESYKTYLRLKAESAFKFIL